MGGDGTGKFIIQPRTAVEAYGDDDVQDDAGEIGVPAEQRSTERTPGGLGSR